MEAFREFNWNDEINAESSPRELLPEGDYEFTVAGYERARHEGSEKLPPCQMAKVTFTIWGAENSAEITENFHLCNIMEWKLSALFLATGLKKHGEPLRMNWNAVTGKRGKCHVIIHKYKDRNGNDRQYNQISKFYAYDEAEKIQTVSPPLSQQQSQPAKPSPYPQNSGWQSGKF